MTLSEISIRRPVFAWMLMAALIVFGAISFQRMGISQMPDVDFPVINIGLRLDNAAPEVMETNVVDIIEDAVMGIEGLARVTSNVSQGIANVTCEFQMKHNVNVALQEVQQRIAQASNQLPSALYPPVITKTNPEDQPIMWVMVTAEGQTPLYQQMMYARNTLKDQFTTISGVGNVVLAGYVDPNLRVWIDSKKLKSYDLTSTDIWNTIQAEQVEQPAGRIEAPKGETNIRVLGEARSPEAFGNLRINSRGGAANYNPISLNHVSKIEEGVADVRAISRFNGKTAVGLGIVKQHGANAVETAKYVREKVQQIQRSLLPGYHLDVKLDTTKYVQESVNELTFTLLLSALLTSLVCYFFLGSWSSTINVLLAIPTSIVGAFIALYFFGFTLNTFTLLGLSLAIGIVVDDAIMMLENIMRHYEMGKPRKQAALNGSVEITFAAIATTMAVAAIFIPVVFMKGPVGRYFYQYGITVTCAVFLSLLEALTLTPMRCARFLHSAKRDNPGPLSRVMDAFMESLSKTYRRSLQWCLNHRAKIILISLGIFAVSIVSMATLRKELIPEQDQSLFLLTIKTPVGTSIEATDEVYKKAEDYLKAQPEIRDYYSTIGNYNNNNVVNAGVIYVILKDQKDRQASQRDIMDRARGDLRKMFPDDEIFTQDLSQAGFSVSRGFPVEFTLTGPDWEKLMASSREIVKRLSATGLVEDINSDYQDGMPEIRVIPDREKAAHLGISVSSLEQEVQYLIGGQMFTANTQYPKEGHRYYIRLRSNPDEHSDPKDLENLYVRNDFAQELIPLSKVATIEKTAGPQLISRVNRQRAIPIYANVAAGKSQQDAIKAVEQIGRDVLPPGYKLEVTGTAAAFREAFGSLIFALILGIAVAYMVLASQFNSFVHPITVLMALPFSFSGALLALFVTHQSLSLFSMIGLILLMGIVKKNSILLVDFTNQKRRSGLAPRQALLEACPVRLRPIVMTSVACMAGAVPAALSWGPGAETRAPMAICIIGGVAVSTFLTLFVVPCAYSLFVKFEKPEKEALP